MNKNVVVVGAGCAGMACGIAMQKRGYQVTLLETRDRVGGLAGGIKFNDNTYEYGPHVFHTTDPEILDDILTIAGDRMIPFERSAKLSFMGRFIQFPFSITDIFFTLPKITFLKAGISLIFHNVKGWFEGDKKLTDSEKVLRRYYGDVLYRIFFKDYLRKVWGIDPNEMSPSYGIHRIPRLGVMDFFSKFKKLFFRQERKEIRIEEHVEKVEGITYTTKAGYSLIAAAMAEEYTKLGGILKLKTSIKTINTKNGVCYSVLVARTTEGEEETIECDHLISTIPISALPCLFSPKAPERFTKAAETLKFRCITFVGMLVDKKASLPASYVYFRDICFNRIMDLSHFLIDIKPSDCTILVAEITCEQEDRYWNDDEFAKKSALDDLEKKGFIKPDQVREMNVFRSAFGYPVYRIGYEEELKTVNEELEKYTNIYSIGRQGQFAYVNTHIVIKMGYELSRKIHEKDQIFQSKCTILSNPLQGPL